MYTIGIGYDIHKLVRGRKLVIGGVTIPFTKGLLGHSDADVLLHALCDALMGAAGLGDIGEHFPDTDARFKGISSRILLRKTSELVRRKKFSVCNIDVVIIAEQPKLVPYKHVMCRGIAEILGIDPCCVNIKAKTNETCGDIGKGKAIAVYVSAMLKRRR